MSGDFEQSHGKLRLAGPRLSNLGTGPTDADRQQDHTPKGTFAAGNQAAVGRSAKAALRRPYRDAEKRVHEALAAGVEPAEADILMVDAAAVLWSARREIGARGIVALGPTIFYSAESVMANHLMREAVAAGITTELGMMLHDRAMAAEQAATRALTAAVAVAKALGGKRKRGRSTLQIIEAEAEEALAGRGGR